MELSNKQTKILAFIISAFSLISAFFSVFSLNTVLQIAVFSTTIIICILAFILFYRAKGHELATQAFLKALDDIPQSNTLKARCVTTEYEVKEVSKLDKEAFPDTYFSHELIRGMWLAYPKGLTGVFDDTGQMIGVFGLWPIKKKIFEKIITGEYTEQDITIESIEKRNRRYWYAGGLIISKKFHVTLAVKILLAESLANWYEEVRDLQKVSMLAGGYSKEGETILRRFGFINVHNSKSETISHSPIYAGIDIPPSEMHRYFSRIFGSVSTRWSSNKKTAKFANLSI